MKMEDFEREYAEELRMMTEESGESCRETVAELGAKKAHFPPVHSAGPPSRRLLDLSSPTPPLSGRKRPLSSESPLPTLSPGIDILFYTLLTVAIIWS